MKLSFGIFLSALVLITCNSAGNAAGWYTVNSRANVNGYGVRLGPFGSWESAARAECDVYDLPKSDFSPDLSSDNSGISQAGNPMYASEHHGGVCIYESVGGGGGQWGGYNVFNCLVGTTQPNSYCSTIATRPEKNLGEPESCPEIKNGLGGSGGIGNNGQGGSKTQVGNPCHVITGNKFEIETDYPGTAISDLRFIRVYNSQAEKASALGTKWQSIYDRKITLIDSGKRILHITRPDGKVLQFLLADGVWEKEIDVGDRLTQTETGWTYITGDTTEIYNTDGQLLSITSRNDRTQSLSYENGQLVSVSDDTGQTLELTYYADGKLQSMTAPGSRTWGYRYDSNGNLEFVDNPDGTTRQYHYEHASYPHALTGITDERNVRYATWGYDSNGKAAFSTHADNANYVLLDYSAAGTTTVTNSRNQATTYTFIGQSFVGLVTEITGPGCSTCSNKGSNNYQYDDRNRLTQKTVNGLVTQYGNYNENGNPGYSIEAAGTTVERRTDYTYDPRFFSKVAVKTEPSVCAGSSKVTRYGYDNLGNLNNITINGFTPLCAAVSRSVTLQYDGPLNQLSQIDGPRTDASDITMLEYYANAAYEGNNRARLRRVTAGGIVLRDNLQYTLTGRLASEERPNSLTLSYTYYPGNDRLETVIETDGATSRTTRWTYLPTGEVETITRADATAEATTLTLGYDNARRLTRVMDHLGNRVEYILDTEGNMTGQDIYDDENVLHHTISQAYDIYNQLNTSTLVDEVTDFEFEADGTVAAQTNNKQVTTQYGYDSLRRLTSVITDADSIGPSVTNTLTRYQYDVADNLTQVISPNNATTQYTYDDLGNLLQEASPDRGTTVYTYGGAGNVATKTDGRGIQAIYSHDALNRLTAIDYPGTDEDVSVTYDEGSRCANGIGRLCSISDQSGLTEYSYDPFGNIKTHYFTAAGTTFTTQYKYNLRDQVTQIITPTGREINYTPNAIGQNTAIDAMLNGAQHAMVHDMGYRADGQLTQAQFGNGFQETRLYNLKGRLTSLTQPAVSSSGAALIANNDSASTYHFVPVDIAVLTNDVISNSQNVYFTVSSAPSNGTATVNADGTITYSPRLHFAGNDTFQYSIGEGADTDTAYVTIQIIDRDGDGDGIYDSVDTDADNDGMPDTWEVANGFNYLDPSDAALDANGDGISNLLQSQIDTDPTIVNVAWTDVVGAVVNDKTLTKTLQNNNYGNAGAASVQSISGDGSLQFIVTKDMNAYLAVGFSTANLTEAMTDLSYGFNFLNGYFNLIVSGAGVGVSKNYQSGDTLRLERIDSAVHFYHNGSLIYTSTVPSTGTLVADIALSHIGSEIKNAVLFGVTPEGVAPVLSNFNLSSTTGGDVIVTWNSDEAANSQVRYGINSPDEFSTVVDNNFVTSHQTAIIGLPANTTYQYQVVSVDGYGNQAISSTNTFTTPNVENIDVIWTDLVGATANGSMLTGIAASGWNAGAVSTQAIITDGSVEFTISDAFKYSQLLGLSNSNNSTQHNNIGFAFAPFSYNRLYIYENGSSVGYNSTYQNGDSFRVERVSSAVNYYHNDALVYISTKTSSGPLFVDAAPFTTGSTMSNVTISRATETAAPVMTNIMVTLESTGVALTWDTDEVATSRVNYGVSTPTEFSTSMDQRLVQSHRVTLFDLLPNTTYQYQVISQDTFGNVSTSAVSEFTTSNVVSTQVAWTDLVGISVNGNALTKTAANGWGNSGAASSQAIGGNGGIGFVAIDKTTYRILGLSTTNASAAYNTVEHGIFLFATGYGSVYESGSNVFNFGAYQIGDRFRVERSGNTITYYKNDAVMYTSTKTSTGSLIADIGLYNTGGQIKDVVIYSNSLITALAPQPQLASNTQSILAVVVNPHAIAPQEQYIVWRKGLETHEQWVQTAEDPNAYDRPSRVIYISPSDILEWGDKQVVQMEIDARLLMGAMAGKSAANVANYFIKVSHGTPTTPVNINTETLTYTYDGVGNVKTITNDAGIKVFQYDNLERLTQEDIPGLPFKTFGYDRNSNRTTETVNLTTSTYEVIGNSNKYSGQPDGAVIYDAAGNMLSEAGGSRTYNYNNAGRLYQVFDNGTLVATYTYNALGQRIKKVTSSATILYHYNLSGKIISETTQAGTPLRDYVYNATLPVAQIDALGTTDAVGYIHTDHLGTPRRVTDASGTVVWSWDGRSFGSTAANDDPDGDGVAFTLNLRFAGQYYDQETGLHYNYFRYYDPSTGRYMTYDPLSVLPGLIPTPNLPNEDSDYYQSLTTQQIVAFGLNHPYAYVGGNPANKIDPLGLIECRRGYVPDPKGSGGCVPTDKVDPQRCVTAECAAGLPYKESDLRTQCQIDKDLCVFNCQISTAFAGIIANRIIDGGLIGAGVIMGERKSMCELACGIEHGF